MIKIEAFTQKRPSIVQLKKRYSRIFLDLKTIVINDGLEIGVRGHLEK